MLLNAGGLKAFTVNMADEGTFISWPPERTAVFFRVGSDGAAVEPAMIGDLGRAFAEWAEKSRGEISFIYEGLLEEGAAVRDGHNTLVWVTGIWPHGPETAAVTTIWQSEETGRIAEVDIEFNARDYSWNLPDSPDLLETALHEIGHLLGIGHSFNPGAVMYDTSYPGVPPRRTLSRDDLEALSFLYPGRDEKIFAYDLPVLLYPRHFPGEAPVFPPGPGLDHGSDHWVTALGSIDLSRDGYLSDLLAAVRDDQGRIFLQGWTADEYGENNFRELGPSREITRPGEVAALAGIDYNRDGTAGEAAVLIRDGAREDLLFFNLDSFLDVPEEVRPLAAPPADNLIGMAALDSDGSGFRDSLLILRAYPGQYSLFLHRTAGSGEPAGVPDPGIEIPLPGLQQGARILALAALDAEGWGRADNLVFLELDSSADYWIHLFTLVGSEAGSYDVSYRNSLRLPSPPGPVHPGLVTGLDLNRDGFYNQLIIHAPRK